MLYKAAKLGVGVFLFSRCVLFWHVLSESCDKVEGFLLSGAILLACACGSGSEERVVVLGCHPGRWHRQTAQVVPVCAVPRGWVVRTDPGRLDLLFAACPFPSERSAFPAGKKSWSTKHLLGIRVCRVALPSPPQSEGSAEARPHCWGFSIPRELYWQLSKEWEETSFTESPLVNLLLWICLECRYQWFYSWIPCGTKPGIVFCVKLINAQKIWTWDWLLSSKKKKYSTGT